MFSKANEHNSQLRVFHTNTIAPIQVFGDGRIVINYSSGAESLENGWSSAFTVVNTGIRCNPSIDRATQEILCVSCFGRKLANRHGDNISVFFLMKITLKIIKQSIFNVFIIIDLVLAVYTYILAYQF